VYRHGGPTMEASLHETDGDTVFGPNSVEHRSSNSGEITYPPSREPISNCRVVVRTTQYSCAGTEASRGAGPRVARK
jgi:hypothetical protein